MWGLTHPYPMSKSSRPPGQWHELWLVSSLRAVLYNKKMFIGAQKKKKMLSKQKSGHSPAAWAQPSIHLGEVSTVVAGWLPPFHSEFIHLSEEWVLYPTLILDWNQTNQNVPQNKILLGEAKCRSPDRSHFWSVVVREEENNRGGRKSKTRTKQLTRRLRNLLWPSVAFAEVREHLVIAKARLWCLNWKALSTDCLWVSTKMTTTPLKRGEG